jgi:hypothetical protein
MDIPSLFCIKCMAEYKGLAKEKNEVRNHLPHAYSTISCCCNFIQRESFLIDRFKGYL